MICGIQGCDLVAIYICEPPEDRRGLVAPLHLCRQHAKKHTRTCRGMIRRLHPVAPHECLETVDTLWGPMEIGHAR